MTARSASRAQQRRRVVRPCGLAGLALTRVLRRLARYVWKLLYIYMLGYDVEFGHMEARERAPAPACGVAARQLTTHTCVHAQAVGLISSPKYAEKQVGYMVTSVLLNEVRAPRSAWLRLQACRR